MNNNLVATKILVAAGADRTIKNSDGRDAFALAEGDDDKIDALRTADEKKAWLMDKANAAGTLDGEPVSHGEYRSAYLSAYMARTLSQGSEVTSTPENEALLRRLSWQRLATLREAAKLGIGATDEELNGAIHSNFAETNGASNPKRYQDFLENMIRPMGFSPDQFEQHLREEVAIQKLGSLIGRQAHVTPLEIRRTFETLMDSYLIEYATIRTADIEKKAKVSEVDARQLEETDIAVKAKAIQESATLGLAAGKSFEQSVAGLGVEVSAAEPFTGLSGSSSTNLAVQALVRAVVGYNQGEVADPVPAEDGMIVAYLKARTPADPANFDSYREEIASAIRTRRAQGLFLDWQASLLAPERFTDFQLAAESVEQGRPKARALEEFPKMAVADPKVQALFQSQSPEALEQLATVDPKAPTAPMALASAAAEYYAQRRYDEALSVYQRFLSIYPDHMMVHDAQVGVAACYEALDNFESAAKAYEAFASASPTSALLPQAVFGAARCYELLGQFDKARTLYETFIVANAASSWLPQAESGRLFLKKAERASKAMSGVIALPAEKEAAAEESPAEPNPGQFPK